MKLTKHRFVIDGQGIIIQHRKKFSRFTAIRRLIEVLKYSKR